MSLAGIVLLETQQTFVLQGDDETPRRVPKSGSTFRLALPSVEGAEPVAVHLEGEQLVWR